MSTRGDSNKNTRGGYRNSNSGGRQQQPQQQQPYVLMTKTGHISLVSSEGVKVTVKRQDWWPITMSVYDIKSRNYDEYPVVQTNWPERAIRQVVAVVETYYYDADVIKQRPFTTSELTALIDIVSGFVGVKAYDHKVFKNLRLEDALKSVELTPKQIEILSRPIISDMDDRSKYIIPTGKYTLIAATTDYNAYNEAFYTTLVKLGGLQKDSDAWKNLNIRTGFGYELFDAIVSAGASDIFIGHTKKLVEIAAEWPKSALKLLDVKLPPWKPTDVPREHHPAYRMVGILNIAHSYLEKYALLQELHDDFHVTLPLAVYRSHFRSILHGYGISLRLYNGSRNPYPIEVAFLYNMEDIRTPTDFKQALIESRKIIIDEVLTAQKHIDLEDDKQLSLTNDEKDSDSSRAATIRDSICINVSRRMIERFKALRFVEDRVMYTKEIDNPFMVFSVPQIEELLNAMVSIARKGPADDSPSLQQVKDEKQPVSSDVPSSSTQS